MRRLALVAIVASALLGTATAAAQTNNAAQKPSAPPARCTIEGFRPFSAKVWNPNRWRRGMPPARILGLQHEDLACAPPAHRHAMKATWRRDAGRFWVHRHVMRWRMLITPFYGCTSIGGCNWWAIPVGMVECESGGNYYFPYGAYSMLDPAWHEWGGRTEHAGQASPAEQDLAAHHGWVKYGEGAWECKSDGSTSWP